MTNYQEGKLYEIRSESTGLIYIGATVQTLEQRMTKHKCSYDRYQRGLGNFTSSFEVLQSGDAQIHLIRDAPCASRKELNREEGKEQRARDCVNEREEGRTNKEYKVDHKDQLQEAEKKRRKEKAPEIKAQRAEYYQGNKKVIGERVKEYLEQPGNKARKQELEKERRKNNPEQFSAYENSRKETRDPIRSEVVLCPRPGCKESLTRHSLPRHHLTQHGSTLTEGFVNNLPALEGEALTQHQEEKNITAGTGRDKVKCPECPQIILRESVVNHCKTSHNLTISKSEVNKLDMVEDNVQRGGKNSKIKCPACEELGCEKVMSRNSIKTHYERKHPTVEFNSTAIRMLPNVV